MENPVGLIVILHNGFAKITAAEAVAALPSAWHSLHRQIVEVNYSELLELQKLYDTGYGPHARLHRRQFAEEILPLITKYPNFRIVYFGLAPIPLCIDLGHLFHNYREITIYQKHHVSKQWYTDTTTDGVTQGKITVSGMPDHQQKGIGEALIRLAVSHPVNPEDTTEILPNAAEIDIALDHPDEDAVGNTVSFSAISEAVKGVFDDLSNNRSSLETLHFFAAIPCGVAFLVGTKISPNIHSYIQTYQFSRTREPRYAKALLVKGEMRVERKLTEEEHRQANDLRRLADEELTGNIRNYCRENENMTVGRSWVRGIVPTVSESIMNTPFWRGLPALYETSLQADCFAPLEQIVKGTFFWRLQQWFVDDDFFISLKKRIGADAGILSAVRLFLFHEALHYKRHRLNDHTTLNIGSFPKVLETADYQADVYALLNEYGYQYKMNGVVVDARQFFLSAIHIATETMWSFDDNGEPLTEIQIRRLNRYLNWYWQYARIEKEGTDINKILSILEEKPVIELNGLKTKEEDNRFFVILEKKRDQPLELAVFHDNQLIRDGSATNLVIEVLVQGVTEMKAELILQVLRSFLSR